MDHFLPWVLKERGEMLDADSIWNLVLSCQRCNRGEGGKFYSVPSARLVARLHERNNWLVDSHHPLRETIMLQTGADASLRARLLPARLHRVEHFKCDLPIPLRHSRQHVRLPDAGHAVIRLISDSGTRHKCMPGIPSTQPSQPQQIACRSVFVWSEYLTNDSVGGYSKQWGYEIERKNQENCM